MKCPKCKILLSSTIFHNVEVDYCARCLGLWFNEDELRWAKDDKEEELKWFDVDLWKDDKKFKLHRGIRVCPECRVPLYEVYYGHSRIVVDVCNLCRGTWLDRGEFKNIIDWIRQQANYQLMRQSAVTMVRQASEIFSGPETLREEISDLALLAKLLSYKWASKHSLLTEVIASLPK